MFRVVEVRVEVWVGVVWFVRGLLVVCWGLIGAGGVFGGFGVEGYDVLRSLNLILLERRGFERLRKGKNVIRFVFWKNGL